jgi:hypothetical protein
MRPSLIDSLRKLKDSATKSLRESIDDLYESSPGADYVEKLIYVALQTVARAGLHEHTEVRFLDPKQEPPPDLADTTTIFVSPQNQISSERFDFAVFAYDHKPRYLAAPGWRRLVVECDVTTETPPVPPTSQYAEQKSIVVAAAAIMLDPWVTAEAIFDWASSSFGY